MLNVLKVWKVNFKKLKNIINRKFTKLKQTEEEISSLREKCAQLQEEINQVEQLQKDLETLAKEFAEAASKFEDADELSRQQKTCIAELENALQEAKKNYSEDIANGFNNLNTKIVEVEEQTQVLTDQVKFLANELTQLGSSDQESIKVLKNKIKELEMEKNGLEAINYQLEKDIKINPQFSKDINGITPVSDDDNISSHEQFKLSRQEATIAQQNNVIKALQDKISELEESHKLFKKQILRHVTLFH
ncbi:Kinesin family member 4/21/27 [Gigaspora margarita]|uniref:Kinesin family member 4/21/27 n=1 Tax=Gigaspora margarita TaxID=4874 RepID=A0A8H3XDK7_GIGMA|nr:Kinesin family member 4/21/27 [Gigaspora margarita]